MDSIRAILTCVDFGDILAVTLPYNRHHFEEVMVVTTPTDLETLAVAKACNARVVTTDSFYDDGAEFNKWKALEEGLDAFGRHGLMCIMDADIMWPKKPVDTSLFENGCLYTPQRRMWYDTSQFAYATEEKNWKRVELANEPQWAGYTQIFHADDSHLPPAPWHELNWKHAGGADSAFQDLWPQECKRRPSWNVLHLGVAGLNWCGRSTPRLDGSLPVEAEERRQRLFHYYDQRRYARGEADRYKAERLK